MRGSTDVWVCLSPRLLYPPRPPPPPAPAKATATFLSERALTYLPPPPPSSSHSLQYLSFSKGAAAVCRTGCDVPGVQNFSEGKKIHFTLFKGVLSCSPMLEQISNDFFLKKRPVLPNGKISFLATLVACSKKKK